MTFVESCEAVLYFRVWDVRCYSYVMIIHSNLTHPVTVIPHLCNGLLKCVQIMTTYHFPTYLRRFLLKIVGAGFFFLVLEATFDLQRILQQFLSAVVAPNLRRVLLGRRNRRRGFGDFVTCQLVFFWLRSRFG